MLFSHVIPAFFFFFFSFLSSPSKLKGRSRAVEGAHFAFPLAVDATSSSLFPPQSCSFLARGDLFSPHSDLSVAMAGAIIENMSTKKLVIVGVILLLFQAFAFMVGGLIGKFSPSSFISLSRLANVCLCVRVPVEF